MRFFAAFGSVKRVKLPKKMDGTHRGFAFVEFSSHHGSPASDGLLVLHASLWATFDPRVGQSGGGISIEVDIYIICTLLSKIIYSYTPILICPLFLATFSRPRKTVAPLH